MEKLIIALAGGVGGAKLAQGLAAVLPPEELTIVVNTGDDFTHLGLAISPDIDTVTYTLAGINNKETGWGLAGETWEFMKGLKNFGCEHWFQLGDKDLATHFNRTQRYLKGGSLSEITREHCQKLSVKHAIIPMTDQPAPTLVHTSEGILAFQDYFVKRRCEPKMMKIEYPADVHPSDLFLNALKNPKLEAIVICPSNPFLSIGPIFNLSGIKEILKKRKIPVVAVSPIIGGKAVKGPAAKIMSEMGIESSVKGIADYYGDLIDGIVIDAVDAQVADTLGVKCCVAQTLMHDLEASATLAQTVIDFAKGIQITT